MAALPVRSLFIIRHATVATALTAFCPVITAVQVSRAALPACFTYTRKLRCVVVFGLVLLYIKERERQRDGLSVISIDRYRYNVLSVIIVVRLSVI